MLTRLLHTRNFAALMLLVSVVASFVAWSAGLVTHVGGNRGIVAESPNLWIANPALSFWLNQLMITAIAVGTVAIIKVYNIMRMQTALWASIFVIAQAALPPIAGQFYGGTILCAVIVVECLILFGCYGNTSLTRRVFLMFFIMTACSFVQYAFLFFIPILIPGLAQMRILNLRSILAALMGVVCLPFIVFGCGLAEFSDIRWPEFVGTLSVLDTKGMIVTFTIVALTIAMGVGAMAANLMKLLSYNSKFRSANGFITIVMMEAILLVFIDYNNLSVYIPLLNLLTAYQIAHFFSNNRTPGSYIGILSVMAVFILGYCAAFIF